MRKAGKLENQPPKCFFIASFTRAAKDFPCSSALLRILSRMSSGIRIGPSSAKLAAVFRLEIPLGRVQQSMFRKDDYHHTLCARIVHQAYWFKIVQGVSSQKLLGLRI